MTDFDITRHLGTRERLECPLLRRAQDAGEIAALERRQRLQQIIVELRRFDAAASGAYWILKQGLKDD